MVTSRIVGILGLVLAVAGSAACAAAPDEESAAQADAISSEQAAAEWKGATQILERFPASRSPDLVALGVASWDLFLVKTSSFEGLAAFAVGADGHVRHALVSGSSKDGQAGLTLVNYDKAGKTGATDHDVATLRALAQDIPSVQDAASRLLTERADGARRVAEAARSAADASQKVVDANRRLISSYDCQVDILTLGAGIVGVSVGVSAAVMALPLAAMGTALALFTGALSVTGAAVVGFRVGDMARSLVNKTSCFAR